ncbi:hypothetical protein MSG28_008201, partial [Choristoneura fumiferana]
VRFVRNASGKELALVRGYTFYCGAKNLRTNIWRCTRWGTCKARFIMTKSPECELLTAQLEHAHSAPNFIINVIWTRNNRGKELLVVNGYTFYRHTQLKYATRWVCTLGTDKCRAHVKTVDPIWTRNNRGKELIIVNGYTFYCHTQQTRTVRWACTFGTSKCHASVSTVNGAVTRAKLHHTHPANKFVIKDGVYMKL